ncbi:MAG TPA: C39 family peptidase [Alphaproteobacteria bacterium]|nr:C39 family peptidase [Alphaproteobacteria bacterium]
MQWRRTLLIAALFPAVLLASAPKAYCGQVALVGDGMVVAVKSMKELRDSRIVHQKYDFSCGSAAIATLLTYSYDEPTTERQAFKAMYAAGDRKTIRKVGFSLLDMQKYLRKVGIRADGYKVSLERLRSLHLPAITLISPHGYNHFVVLRGWEGNSIILADPSRGLRRIPVEDFAAMWKGIVFVLHNQPQVAQANYNDPKDLKLLPRAPLRTASAGSQIGLGSFLINLPIYNEY